MKGDYNEWLISQAGGDGEKLVDVTVFVSVPKTGGFVERMNFTNIPTDRVKDVIDLLNDDPTPNPPRTEDFTLTELYGWYDGTQSAKRTINCFKCGAVVSYDHKFLDIHQNWHNKLLP